MGSAHRELSKKNGKLSDWTCDDVGRGECSTHYVSIKLT